MPPALALGPEGRPDGLNGCVDLDAALAAVTDRHDTLAAAVEAALGALVRHAPLKAALARPLLVFGPAASGCGLAAIRAVRRIRECGGAVALLAPGAALTPQRQAAAERYGGVFAPEAPGLCARLISTLDPRVNVVIDGSALSEDEAAIRRFLRDTGAEPAPCLDARLAPSVAAAQAAQGYALGARRAIFTHMDLAEDAAAVFAARLGGRLAAAEISASPLIETGFVADPIGRLRAKLLHRPDVLREQD